MLGYALVFVAMSAAGNIVEGAIFKTKAECEAAATQIHAKIPEYNRQAEEKIVAYSLSCQPVVPAKAGVSL